MTRLTTALCLTLVAGAARADETATLTERARAVLSRVKGELALPGLKEPVEVLRDRWGVPHIYAKNQDDLFFAQGFVVAQDRLFQIDTWRRVGVGETAEVVGPRGLDGDRFARLVRYRGDMNAEWDSYSPDTRRIAAAFTNGINACIDHAGDRLPIEFQLLGTRPKKWRPGDVLARMSGIIMSRNFSSELSRAELVAAVGVEKARKLLPTDPRRDFVPAPGLDLAGIDRSLLALYNAATAPLPFRGADGGSNNWVVDGTLSASGKPLLAADPHRTMALPSLRYIVHLHAPGWNVIGAGEPGVPGVALGHNERVAWGITIVGTDQADWYVEQTHPDDTTRYKVGDRWEPMTVVREKVAVRGAKEPAEVELRFTRHGPVIHQDAKRHRAYALRWSGSEPGGAAYLASLAIDRAGSARELVREARRWKIPALNVTHADVDGNIGWVAAGLTPVRRGWDGLLPVPGWDGAYEWQRFLSVEELPQAANPANQWLMTANHNILPPDYRQEISYEWSLPYRADRLRQRLGEKKTFALDDFKSMHYDSVSLPGRRLAALAKHVGDETLRSYVELLSAWDGTLSRDSRAGPLYAVWTKELLDEFFRPHVPEKLRNVVAASGNLPLVLDGLEKPTADWFAGDPAEERNKLLRRTLASAVKKTRELTKEDISAWRWGKLHTLTLRHPLAGLGPAYDKAFGLAPVERPGDGVTPHAAGHDVRFRQITGASYRHVLDLADWDRGMATSVPGQSGQPGSPHYADLLPLWAEGEYFPLAFSRKKVEEVTRNRLVLKPPR